MLVYLDHDTNDVCLAGRAGAAGTTSGGESEQLPAAGRIIWQLAGGGPGIDGEPTYFLDGTVGSGVNAVTLVLEGGTKVRATIAGGWFAAWWPGHTRALAVEAATAQGTTSESLALPEPAVAK